MEVISLVFILTSILIILTPGQDMVMVLSRSLSAGKKAGIITALGVSVGLLGHTLLATFGLGAILLASETLFNIIKVIGALYLMYIGYQLLKANGKDLVSNSMSKTSYKKMFLQGALSNVMNPKITIFYFAYLPQFVDTSLENQSFQLFILGFTFAVLTFLIKAPIGFVSGILSFWIKTKTAVLNGIFKVSGMLLIVLGIKLILEERK